jgi:hypothetical protein
MARVAADVTRDGPVAWQRYFENEPAFFMVSEGQLVFPNGASAEAAIPMLVKSIARIELSWGPVVRIDALTGSLAVVATQWHEVRIDAAGQRTEEGGFFTGTVEYTSGRWQFRNAHWSVAAPARAVP